jgi:hypothetical protein
VNRSLDHPLDTRVAVTGFTARRADCQVLSAPTPNAINGQSLTNSTAGSGSPIEPRAMACAPGAPMKVSVPPSGVVSIVMER